MWEVLGEGMLGYVVLVDAARPESVPEAVTILAAFRKMASVPFVVALNRSAGLEADAEAEVRAVLELEPDVPIVPATRPIRRR